MIYRVFLVAALLLAWGSGGWWGGKPCAAQTGQPAKTEISTQPAAPAVTDNYWEDAKKHGAKGDGKTDDTQAIQKAIDAAARGAKVVLIPPGVYLTSGPGLRLTASEMTLKGLGKYTSIIQHSGEQAALTVGTGAKPPCTNVRIADLQFQGKNAKGHGILLSDYAVRYAVDNVCVTGFDAGTGIKAVDHNHSGHISQVDISGNATGISIGDQGQYTDISYSKIYHNKVYGVELTDNNVINLISCQLEKNGETKGASVMARGVNALNLIGCYNEQNHLHSAPFLILTKGVTRGPCRAVNLVGCRSIGNQKAPNSVVLESAQNVTFSGNVLGSFPGGIFALKPIQPNHVKMISGQGNVLNGAVGADIFSLK